ncbi:26S proteasome non-ATPase regulatory subunit 6-like [Paramacrobiotus metropolitanus]|uniref:26S proteasome non-ATPase regulatory subunit 6-like n=1 Tax=Paramacrobiotus metropolitanus TaxID=2943436 RepID=UPI002446302F|nr:26S proteasome non-ATPase regulatory subunit 6-like [Paramacrobiotus metropolitanus]
MPDVSSASTAPSEASDGNEDKVEKNPDFQIAQWLFLLKTDQFKNDSAVKNSLMEAIKANEMAPYYEMVTKTLGFNADTSLLNQLRQKNEQKIKELDAAILDAEQNLGSIEVREAYLAKFNYLSRTGDKEAAESAFRQCFEKTVGHGNKLDLIFQMIRIGLFFDDLDLTTRNLDKARSLVEEGGDWDRRNRLKVYEGLHFMKIREFPKATTNFLDSVSTFTCSEILDYDTFVTYAVLCAMLTLERVKLKEKVVRSAEIAEVLFRLPDLRQFLSSLYGSHYAEFFLQLANVEQKLKVDRYWADHYRYYTREMRILAYNQLLESYQSLTLDYMGQAFGVTAGFIDKELSRFIAAGRLHCKIDKVNGVVETTRPDNKNRQYQLFIKQGDHLLNKIQRLSRVINV